jgi:isopentenyl-diphosphate Delta-isomerase
MTDHEEHVVLVDDAGNATGEAPKRTVHHEATPLHLAFSCYVFDTDGRLLLTQRALHKPTWPGIWSNSFCGHPAPGEEMYDAVRRRAEQELGVALVDLQLVLPRFRYEATMENGVREHELCPVFTAIAAGQVEADPAEVAAIEWVPWSAFRDDVLARRRDVSPWCVEQVAALAEREEAGGRFATATPADLPPAARG